MKTFKIRSEGTTYRVAKATLYVGDYSQFGEYNHPEIVLMMRPSGPQDPEERRDVMIQIRFQRHSLESQIATRNPEGMADRYMDTARLWSHTYGGDIELDRADRVPLHDRPHTLRPENKLRVAIARKLARLRNERNLHAVYRCEVQQIMRLLSDLGVHVKIQYCLPGGGSVDTLSELPYSRANERYRQSLREGEEALS